MGTRRDGPSTATWVLIMGASRVDGTGWGTELRMRCCLGASRVDGTGTGWATGPKGVLGRVDVQRVASCVKECLIEITVDILGDPTGSGTPCRGKRHHRGAIPERGTTQHGALTQSYFF